MKNDRIWIRAIQHSFQIVHAGVDGSMNPQQTAQPLVSGRNSTGRYLHGSLQHTGRLEIPETSPGFHSLSEKIFGKTRQHPSVRRILCPLQPIGNK